MLCHTVVVVVVVICRLNLFWISIFSSHDSPTSSVSSLHSLNAAAGTSSLATAALKPSIPSLTPSLANYYREDLISHVVGWQADHAERQVSVCLFFYYFFLYFIFYICCVHKQCIDKQYL